MKIPMRNLWMPMVPCNIKLWVADPIQTPSVASYKPRGEVLSSKRINRLTKKKLTK